LAELAAMEAAGATEVKAGTSSMEPSAPGISAAVTITPARRGTTSARATRARKTSTSIRPSSAVEGDYEDLGTVTDDNVGWHQR
jgi:hypothetical protein